MTTQQSGASMAPSLAPGTTPAAYGVAGNAAYMEAAGQQPIHGLDPPLTLWRRIKRKLGFEKKLSDHDMFSGDLPFKIVYEARPVPTVNNPLRYAYDSLALPGTAVVGRATAIRRVPGMFTMPGELQGQQTWSLQGVLVSGLPINTGQMFGQPLYNPTVPGGFVNSPADHMLPTRNIPL